MLKCRDCESTGQDFKCPDIDAILCDDCYTVARFKILNEHNLKDLFEVDKHLNIS